jgi:hypothetical protein
MGEITIDWQKTLTFYVIKSVTVAYEIVHAIYDEMNKINDEERLW